MLLRILVWFVMHDKFCGGNSMNLDFGQCTLSTHSFHFVVKTISNIQDLYVLHPITLSKNRLPSSCITFTVSLTQLHVINISLAKG